MILPLFLLTGLESAYSQMTCTQVFNDLGRSVFVRFHMREAKILYDQGRMDEATDHLLTLLREDSNDYQAMSLYSRILYVEGSRPSLEKAYKLQKRVLKSDPSFRESGYLSMAQILAALGRTDEAIIWIQTILRHNPEHTGALGMLARQYINKGELRKARDITEDRGRVSYKLGKIDPQYLGLSAEIYFKLGDLNIALRRANELINSFRPRYHQKRVSKHFITGLLIKAKMLVKDPLQITETHRLLDQAKHHLGFFSWFELLRAEAYFREGKIIEAKKTLIAVLNKSRYTELEAIAGLIKINNQHNPDDPLLKELFKRLNEEQVQQVMLIYKSLDWNVQQLGQISAVETYSNTRNNFWEALHTIPVNLQAIGRRRNH